MRGPRGLQDDVEAVEVLGQNQGVHLPRVEMVGTNAPDNVGSHGVVGRPVHSYDLGAQVA